MCISCHHLPSPRAETLGEWLAPFQLLYVTALHLNSYSPLYQPHMSHCTISPGLLPLSVMHAALVFSSRFKRGTSQYLGMDDEDESEQSERLGPAGSPDRAQVRLCHIGLRLMPWMVADPLIGHCWLVCLLRIRICYCF